MSTCNSFKNTATYCKQKTFEMLSSLGGLSVLPLFLFLARINETNPGWDFSFLKRKSCEAPQRLAESDFYFCFYDIFQYSTLFLERFSRVSSRAQIEISVSKSFRCNWCRSRFGERQITWLLNMMYFLCLDRRISFVFVDFFSPFSSFLGCLVWIDSPFFKEGRQ